MHLIKHDVGDIVDHRTAVIAPPGRIGGVEVDYGRAVAVGTDGLGPHAWSLVEPSPVMLDAECVEFAIVVARQRSSPRTVFRCFHIDGLYGLAVAVGRIYHQSHSFGLG